MTIVPVMLNAVPPPPSLDHERAASIEAWTEQATEALRSVSLNPAATPAQQRILRPGTSVRLSIPPGGTRRPTTTLSDSDNESASALTRRQRTTTNNAYGRQVPIRRDSLKSREALLKGKEGSRQRRRWENGRCSHD